MQLRKYLNRKDLAGLVRLGHKLNARERQTREHSENSETTKRKRRMKTWDPSSQAVLAALRK